MNIDGERFLLTIYVIKNSLKDYYLPVIDN